MQQLQHRLTDWLLTLSARFSTSGKKNVSSTTRPSTPLKTPDRNAAVSPAARLQPSHGKRRRNAPHGERGSASAA